MERGQGKTKAGDSLELANHSLAYFVKKGQANERPYLKGKMGGT